MIGHHLPETPVDGLGEGVAPGGDQDVPGQRLVVHVEHPTPAPPPRHALSPGDGGRGCRGTVLSLKDQVCVLWKLYDLS